MPNRKASTTRSGDCLSMEARVRSLLGQMTLKEKIAQMNMVPVDRLCHRTRFSPGKAKTHGLKQGIGAILTPRLFDPSAAANANASVQEYLRTQTRHGIPALVVAETLHGLMSRGATIFPQSICLASSWNTRLVKNMAQAIAREARQIGVCQGLAPDLDLARDPRWGRVEETYGEDPFLVSEMGAAYVRGLQGARASLKKTGIAATVKHFAAHGSPESGINLGPVSVGPRQLRDLYLPPFHAALAAGALCVMPAYSEFDGIPCHANHSLLTRILRDEWGFGGYVISDFDGIYMLENFHRSAASQEQGAGQAIEAGVDMEAPGTVAYGHRLHNLVKEGAVDGKRIDRAVERILKVKIQCGLFDQRAFLAPKRPSSNTTAHRRLSRKIAEESIVLLQNRNDILPLGKGLKSIAVVGPLADSTQLGDYTVAAGKKVVSPLQAIQRKVRGNVSVVYAQGCPLWEASLSGLGHAMKAVQKADVVLAFVGGTSHTAGGVGWGKDRSVSTCGEGFDRSELGLPGVQEVFLRAIVASGTPTVVVLMNGRPYAIPWLAKNATAIVEAWYPGQEGALALTDVLFGAVNPSGKLPVSFPRSSGHIPCFYNHMPTARGFYKKPGSPDVPGRDYVFAHPTPLFPFGHGLSYTKFKYSNLRITPRKAHAHERIRVCVDVRNAGERAGKEVVQLYLNDKISSVATPVRGLKGFSKIHLRPGRKKTVGFTLSPRDLQLLDRDLNWVTELGTFEAFIGGLSKKFEVR